MISMNTASRNFIFWTFLEHFYLKEKRKFFKDIKFFKNNNKFLLNYLLILKNRIVFLPDVFIGKMKKSQLKYKIEKV